MIIGQGQRDRPQDLPEDDSIIDTGLMTECTCVIVMWEWQDRGSGLWGRRDQGYRHIRGCHGGGGIGNIDFARLLRGVPTNDPQLRIFYVPGAVHSQQAGGELNERRRFVEVLGRVHGGAYSQCRVSYFTPRTRAKFDRLGRLLD